MEKLFFNKGLIRDWLLWERLGVGIWQLPLEKACFSSGLPGAALAQLAAMIGSFGKGLEFEFGNCLWKRLASLLGFQGLLWHSLLQ